MVRREELVVSDVEDLETFERVRMKVVQDRVEQPLVREAFGEGRRALKEIPIGQGDSCGVRVRSTTQMVQDERSVDCVDVFEFRASRRTDLMVEEIVRGLA